MRKSILREKSYSFAIRIAELNRYLSREKKEVVLSKQVLRSGTAIGALIREAEFGQSKRDFRSKMTIALKEANETHYWLSLLKDTGYIETRACLELIKMLVATVKTSKLSEDNDNEKVRSRSEE